ncbi:MAG: putative transport system permease protein [Gaiellales bacterium]|nr:putative transport system permease protein [Gaiellales bacterium]
MTLVAIRGLFGRKLRTVLTMISIILGTAMISGTFVLRDQINSGFSDIFSTGLEGTDIVLSKNTAFTSDSAQPGPMPDSVIDEAKAVPGVGKVEGQVQAIGALVVDGDYAGSSGGAPSFVFSWVSEPFSPNTMLSGHEPQASGEVAINKKLADDENLKVGDKVQLATSNGTVPVTLVGIFNYGDVSSLAGATIVTTTFEDAQRLYDREGQTSTVYVDAASGTSVEELKKNLQEALPNEVKVETAAEAAQSQTDQVAGSIDSFLTPLLLAFAGAAVFVGGFIIFNTFSITVSQRIREFAMLRTIGASSRQVLRSVLLEALLIGVVSSILGLLAGIGFAQLLTAIFGAIGFEIPSTSIPFTPLTVGLPLLVGTSVALAAALGPAFRATRVPPIAALREGAELPPSALARHATPVAAVMVLIGLGGIVDGVWRKGAVIQAVTGLSDTAGLLISLAAGAMLCFLAVAVLAKHVVRPLARGIGWPLEWIVLGLQYVGHGVRWIPGVRPVGNAVSRLPRWLLIISLIVLEVAGIVLIFAATPFFILWVILFPLFSLPLLEWPPERPSKQTGRLARENTVRSPSRTAVTASALMIGLALVVFMAVFVNGFKDSFLGSLDKSITGDLIVQNDDFATIPAAAVTAAGQAQGVDVATGLAFSEVRIGNGGRDFVNGVDPETITRVYTFNWQEGGSDNLALNLGRNDALVEEQFAKSHDLQKGDTFAITSVDNNRVELTVTGQYKDPTLMAGFTVSNLTFDTFSDTADPGVILVGLDDGISPEQGKASVGQALEGFPVANVRTNDEYKKFTEDQVNGFLGFLYVLLGMAVVISLFGIVNTLALSVFERTREIGMLRAVGMTRRQLRRVVRYESVITAVIGGILGIVVGLTFGWILSKGLEDQGIVFSIPYGLLIAVVGAAIIAGILAAILPARRASRLNVLEAQQYE